MAAIWRGMKALQEFKRFPIRLTARAKYLTTGGYARTVIDDIPAKPLPGNR
jgi:hypothetical protein